MAAKPRDLWCHMWPFCSSWIGSHMCKVLSRSVRPFQRRFLKVFIFIFLNNMAAESRDRWRHQKNLWTILSRDDPQNFSYWLDVAFYICNYGVITKAPMTSSKNHTYSSSGVLAMCLHTPLIYWYSLIFDILALYF